MAIEQMPNGEVIEYDDNIDPKVLQRIRAENGAKGEPAPLTRKAKVSAGQKRKSDEPKDKLRSGGLYNIPGVGSVLRGLDDLTTGSKRGITFSLNDEIEGAGGALMGQGYKESRDRARDVDRAAGERSPLLYGVGEVTGGVVNPLGTGATAAGKGAALAEKAGLGRIANALGGYEKFAAGGGAVRQGVLAGGLQGGLNAGGSAEELGDVPESVLMGTALGSTIGGAFGGALNVGRRGIQILSEASPANAERTAYSRVASLLDKAGKTPRQAEREIRVTDARGGDGMVQDLSPGLRAQAASISRKPDVRGSNELIERGEQRINARRDNFGDMVRRDANIPAQGDDALARAEGIGAERKAIGQDGYKEGGIMDTPITPTPALQTYLREAPEEVQDAMRSAYRSMALRDKKAADYVGPDGIFTHIPNLRTFDEVKRAFDVKIGAAIKSGDKPLAQGLSYQLDKLKGVLADANPNDAAYKQLLASQRDLFQKEQAVEIGKTVIQRLRSDPRVLNKELRALPEHAREDARIGILDRLINMDKDKADPVAFMRQIMRNKEQKKVFEFAFDGRGNLNRFMRQLNREINATRADVLTAPGRQSETSRIALAEGDTAADIGNIFSNALRGYAFGGAIGAVSGASRTVQNIATGTSRATQEEIAKILLSKGENLVKGTEAAAAYTKARNRSNRMWSRTAAKAGQQAYTDMIGN